MTVAELIDLLSVMPKDMEVWLEADAWNHYPVAGTHIEHDEYVVIEQGDR